MVNIYQDLISTISGVIFILSGHTHDNDDEPHITEEVFLSCMEDSVLLFYDFPVELLIDELIKHNVLDKSSFKIVASLDPPIVAIDRLHYVMYRIGKKENGLQIFYQCLKETQDKAPEHTGAVSIMDHQGQ